MPYNAHRVNVALRDSLNRGGRIAEARARLVAAHAAYCRSDTSEATAAANAALGALEAALKPLRESRR